MLSMRLILYAYAQHMLNTVLHAERSRNDLKRMLSMLLISGAC